MPKKGFRMSDEQKRVRSEAAKRQHAEGRGNPAGILSAQARAKASVIRMGHAHTPTGEKHRHWKGDAACYTSIHQWLTRHYPRATACDHCGQERKTEWANISGEYKRDRADYLELCRSCHRKHDYAVRPYKFKNGQSKLTEDAVREIRGTNLTPKEVTERYGVSLRAARNVLSGKSWVDVAP